MRSSHWLKPASDSRRSTISSRTHQPTNAIAIARVRSSELDPSRAEPRRVRTEPRTNRGAYEPRRTEARTNRGEYEHEHEHEHEDEHTRQGRQQPSGNPRPQPSQQRPIMFLMFGFRPKIVGFFGDLDAARGRNRSRQQGEIVTPSGTSKLACRAMKNPLHSSDAPPVVKV